MREIQLTQRYVAFVDDEDFEGLNQWKWYTKKNKNTCYAVRNSLRANGRHYQLSMHHEIIGRPPKGFEVDHRDGWGLNNQRHNLRHVTKRQNCQNKKNGRKKSSKYPGVCWKKRPQRWTAEIRINGKRKYLGGFVNECDAFKAYEQAVDAIGEKIIDTF